MMLEVGAGFEDSDPSKRTLETDMARMPRVVVPGVPLHVIQRGNNRQHTFFDDQDYATFLADLGEAAANHGCAVHAYVLMTNHFHLLLTPAEADGPSRLLQAVGRRYVRYVNRKYARTGTLWEGRFRSSPLDSDGYFFACSRYVEMNPVRAGMVADPAAYRWSSFRRNALGGTDAVTTPHPLYLALGSTDRDRQRAYRSLFADRLDADVVESIRSGICSGATVGNDRFRAEVQASGARPTDRSAHGGDRRSLTFRESRQSRGLTP